uniref:Dye-decolorizing peroxidase n=1 Tax=Bjerkandera adusta TaxID=5331 RepID=W8ZBJ5_9APHY|nr:Dye-decolorizing peroxidase [Bjerkandera adusta]
MRLSLFVVSVAVFIGSSTHVSAAKLGARQSRTTPLLTNFPGQAPLPSLEQHSTQRGANTLPLDNIQGDILVGMKKQKERFVFFHVNDATSFKTALKTYVPDHITSAQTLISDPSEQPLAFVNLAFSNTGLQALGVTDSLGDAQFPNGQFADASNLGDDLSQWVAPFTGTAIHGVFLIGSDQDSFLDQFENDISTAFGASITEVQALSGSARPGDLAGHEHFGFLDGISQPAVTGWETTVFPGQAVVPPGIILTGRDGDPTTRPSWALDGSFMAFRHFQQKVPEFNAYTLANAIPANSAGNLTQQEGAEFLGARMFGRWKSGAPIDLAPTADDPALGADPQRNNNFDFSDTLTDETKCPFAAHIRKTNPRQDLGGPVNTFHAIRSSIPYGPETSDAELASGVTSQDRGLLFVEYQSVIGNGFRFQQINWVNNAGFPFSKPIAPGIDPIIGQSPTRSTGGLDPLDQTKTFSVPLFVIPKGGEYFFMPSISALTSTIAA